MTKPPYYDNVLTALKKTTDPDSVLAYFLITSQAKRIEELEFYLQHKDELEYCGDRAKKRIEELERDRKRLETLLNLTDHEGKNGWCITLSYDNYQDGAQIIDADGKVIADCYDIELEPNEQFRKAIDSALKQNENL
jgi:hypothetical protein